LTPAVALTDVWRSFGNRPVLNGVTLTSSPGQVVAVYGRSGSGKTTLLNLVGGLDQPDRGSVRVAGVELAALSPAALSELRRTQMGFIFQSYGLSCKWIRTFCRGPLL
jgi:putative ABC transport system ATP-binding protein